MHGNTTPRQLFCLRPWRNLALKLLLDEPPVVRRPRFGLALVNMLDVEPSVDLDQDLVHLEQRDVLANACSRAGPELSHLWLATD